MSEVWSTDKCKDWLAKEVVSQKATLEAFRNRLIDWHVAEYEKAGNPAKLEWADQCLEVMQKCIKEMNLEESKRRSLFEQFK